ncbi:MAG: hypothetical protein ACRCS9_14410 [Hyphomicrobium sp.]
MTQEFYGEIVKFRRDIGVGIIAAENGRKYRFQRGSVVNRSDDLEGQEVHFILGDAAPRSIVVLAGSPFAAFGATAG